MPNVFAKLFAEHPSEVGESYLEHAGKASSYGWRLLKASLCAYTHAIIPGVHKATASECVCEMARELGGRQLTAREERMRRAGAYDPVI
ncbi:MAG: DUF6356 family protein [Caulobacteraceae bacterium]